MKTLFVSFAALLFAFFLGCQSTITDPVIPEPTKFIGSIEEETVAYKDVFHNTYPYSIRLEGSLLDPSHKLNSFADIDGILRYGIKKVGSNSGVQTPIEFYKSESDPGLKFRVNLYVDAVFKGGCPAHNHPWTAKQAADKIIEVNSSNQSVYYFEKSFKVNGTCCAPLNLVIKFLYEDQKLSIVSMALKIRDGWQPASFEQ